MKNKKKLVLAVSTAAAVMHPLFACDLCSVYSASLATGEGTGFFAGMAEQFTEFNTFKADGHSAPNIDGAFIHSLSSQIFGGYNFNRHLGVQFNLPVLYREFGQVAAHGHELGLGDASLLGNFRLYQKTWQDFTLAWSALGGIKFPTGDPDWLGRPDFATGIGGHDLALGSGSFDGILGTGFSARWKRFFFTGQMQYAVRSEGSFEHQYANDWTWTGGPGFYAMLKENYTLSLSANVSGESKGKDTFDGVPDDDSAETIVYVGPQINFTWSENFSAHLGADLPVSYADSGEQILPSYRIHAAMTWRF